MGTDILILTDWGALVVFVRLYGMMLANGYTEERLGRCLGICRNSMINKLRGHTDWKLSEMEKLQRLLRPYMTLDQLFERSYTL